MAHTPASLMATYANQAVKHARSVGGIELDFSPASVRQLEASIDALVTSQPSGFFARLLAPNRTVLVNMYGAYLGEAIRRAYGWECFYDRELVRGAAITCLKRGSELLYPLMWVSDRMKKVGQRDLWHLCRLAAGNAASASA